MNSMFTYIAKLCAIGHSFFIGLLCLLGSLTTVLGLSLPTSVNTIGEVPKISDGTGLRPVLVSSVTRAAANLSAPVSVSAVEANKCYRLVSRLSGKVLGVEGTAQSDGDKLTQQTDANKLTQGWRFIASGGDYYSIQVLSTQKGIQVANSSTADDALAEQWTYWGGGHQQWRLARNTEGYFTFTNRNSGKVLTVRNASTAEGAPISQLTLGSGQQQQWSIEERSCTATATNQSPVAVATSTSLTGTSPLSVTFTGNKSYDPDGDPITYEWNFGDGSAFSTEANPVKVFTAKAGSQGVGLILNYTVQLTVIDSKGLRSPVQTFSVKLNNSNPTVKITNPINNAKYPLDKSTSYTLGATVTGSISSQLWQVKLRHNSREQLVKTTSGANPVIDISPVGCDGEDYYYVITVKVTDFNNLSGQDSVKIYPDCNSPKLTVTGLTATTLSSSSVRLNWTNPTLPFDKVLVVGRAGSGLTDIPLEPNYTANPSFTGNGSDLPGGGKVLYQGTSTSVVVTDLTAGQPYYFRVYAHAGNGWSGGVEVSATPVAVTANRPPVVVATTSPLTGSSPLSVTFTGDKSYDPDGDQLFYEWAFSDGTYLNVANPVKVFTTQTGQHGSGTITSYTAQLTVTDSKGQRSTSQVFNISLTNTAPTAKITNPVATTKYALDKSTSYTLAATITNAGSSNSILWRVKLRRGNSEQLVTTRSDINPVIDISPVGCDGVDTYYVITLNVTGIGGTTSAQDSVKIYPDCNSSKLTITGLTATTLSSSSVRLNWTNPTLPFDKVLVMGRAGSGLTGIPLESTYTANPSFTGNGSDFPGGGKVLYQGTSTSVVVTDLTAGQPYYFRVYAHAGNGWSGGVEVSTTPTAVTSSAPVSVSAVEANKCYRLVSRLSGKVLGVEGTAQSDGDKLTQQTDANKLTQGWRFIASGGDYYSIQVLSTQKGIQVANSSTADDALAEQWTYWGGGHQQWRLARNTEGYFTFTNRNSGKALTVRNASTAEGAPISQLTLGSGQQQQWSIVEKTCPTGARVGALETGVAFKLWPNPARDHVLIDLSPASGQPIGLQLNDLMGRTLEQTQLETAPIEPYRVNTSQLPDGLYLIRLTPAGQSPTTLRLLIQR
ncbi:hypothetical protein GCM10028808_09420 [Spirosoma migulaei]